MCLHGQDNMVSNLNPFRTNLEVANANASILRLSQHVQIHPMMTPEGRYPVEFAVPRRIDDFLRMSDSQLGRILMVSFR